MTSQLFESTSLEEALAEVRDTVGPGARIVRAEKVRRGGIGGFFAKETFVLSVETSDSDDASDQGDSFRTLPQRNVVSAKAAPDDERPAAYSLDALASSADDADGFAEMTVHQAPVSTETPLFGQVLREVSRATALDHELPPGPRWDGRLADLETAYGSVMPTVPAPAAPEVPPFTAYDEPLVPGQPWWQVLAEVAEAQGEQVQPAAVIDLEAPVRGQQLGSDAIDDLLSTIAPPPPPAPPVGRPDSLADQLTAIKAALGPALLPGSVIAVVGHPIDAREVAAHVAVAAGADPFAIHFASHDEAARDDSGLPGGRQLSSLDEAILRSRRWPSRPTPMVVVVDGRDSRWARTVLDAVETTTVVALPSPADDETAVRAWVGQLGGVQALIVDDSCVSKPETLALYGIPALRSPWSLDRPVDGA